MFPVVSRTGPHHVIKSLTLMRLQTQTSCSWACRLFLSEQGLPQHPRSWPFFLLPPSSHSQHFLQHPFYHHPLTLFFPKGRIWSFQLPSLLLIKLHQFSGRLICYSSHTTTKQMHLGSHWVPTFHAGLILQLLGSSPSCAGEHAPRLGNS